MLALPKLLWRASPNFSSRGGQERRHGDDDLPDGQNCHGRGWVVAIVPRLVVSIKANVVVPEPALGVKTSTSSSLMIVAAVPDSR
jgi:hypothetical protein